MAFRTCSEVMSGTSARLGGPWGCFSRSWATTATSPPNKTGATRAAKARKPPFCSEPITSGLLSKNHGVCTLSVAASVEGTPRAQRAQRLMVNGAGWMRRKAPPRGAGRSTALGSIKRSHQASKELWCAGALARHVAALGSQQHQVALPRPALLPGQSLAQ